MPPPPPAEPLPEPLAELLPPPPPEPLAERSAEPRIRVGVDIVGVDRVARLVTENPAIVDALFTSRELSYCLGKRRCHEHMAARFAAKEAVLKSLGCGLGRRMRWTDVEIERDAHGKPHVRLHAEVATWAQREGLADLDVSLSHAAGMAMAQAVAVLAAGPRAFRSPS